MLFAERLATRVACLAISAALGIACEPSVTSAVENVAGGAGASAGAGGAGDESTGGTAGTAGTANPIESGGTGGTPLPNNAGSSGQNPGGQGGDSSSLALSIVTANLPSGFVNRAYEVQLEAQGGASKSYKFELSAGALPAGLTLLETGIISGKPADAGNYEFDVQVRDERRQTAQAHYALHVRGRYLVYQSNELGGQRLFASDISQEKPAIIQLTPDLPATADVASFAFSPDGKTLAYVADAITDNIKELFLIDMSGPTPGDPLHVEGSTRIARLAWSPDSATLAFNTGDLKVRYVDLKQSRTTVQGTIGTDLPPMTLQWLGSSILALMDRNSSMTYWEFNPKTGFSLPQTTTAQGELSRVRENPKAVMLLYHHNQCNGFNRLFDFETKSVLELSMASYSADFRFSSLWEQSRNAYVVRPTGSTEEDEIVALLPGMSRSCFATWSNQNALVMWLDDVAKLKVADINSAAKTQHTVLGPYSRAGVHTFSPDDRFIVFESSGEVFVTELKDGVPSTAAQLTPTLPDEEATISLWHFSRDSKSIAYVAPQESADQRDLYVADLRTRNYRRVTAESVPNGFGFSISTPTWSQDSAHLAYKIYDSKASDKLLVANRLDSLEPVMLNAPKDCETDAKACSRIESFVFQP